MKVGLRTEPARATAPAGLGEPRRMHDGRSRALLAALCVLGAAAVAFGLVLRFWTHSDLWLDEALTVNVARLPLHELPQALRRDGAPPLYYFLLHLWMRGFGQGDLAVRSLSGLFGVASLPLAWLAGRRLGGRQVAWAAVLLMASSPFAIRYSTENRMYALVIFLTLVGYLALDSVMRKPRPAGLVVLAVSTGLLLYSHYWSLYLVLVVGVCLAWRGLRGSRQALWALGAMVVGSLTFIPWLPVFVFQLQHTGTPWALPASFSAMVHSVEGFAGGDASVTSVWNASPTRALGLIFFFLGLLALFGVALDRRRIELDLATRPWARPLTVVTVGTLAVAIVVGAASTSTFAVRYTAVVFGLFILLMALGVRSIAEPLVRYGIIALAVILGLSVGYSNVNAMRSQASQVAAAINASAARGDVVGYCPDQLGPSVSRLVTADVTQTTFPRRTGPQIVDWVDYARHTETASPAAFAHYLVQLAGPTRTVWLVWAPGYRTLDGKCQQIEQQLGAVRPSRQVVAYNSTKYYEFSDLVRYPPG